MSIDKHEITQTMPTRGGPNREGARQGALIVIGDGASIEQLRAPRLVPMAERDPRYRAARPRRRRVRRR